MRARVASVGAGLLVAALMAASAPVLAGSVAATTPPTMYDVALGDSLATGGGATPGHSYVDDVYTVEKARFPGLQLENLACAGDSTTKMIHGGNCTTYTTGNQLGDAEAFLAAHAGQVKFVTIDVGGDDVDGCAPGGVINSTCVQRGMQALAANMQTILSGIRKAAGAVPLVGMTYYDPWLSYYLDGTSGQQTADASLALLHQLNTELRSAFSQYQARFASVQKSFHSWDNAPTGSYSGQVLPQDVANICNWTHMCEANPNVHTNDTGHALIASAFEAKLNTVH